MWYVDAEIVTSLVRKCNGDIRCELAVIRLLRMADVPYQVMVWFVHVLKLNILERGHGMVNSLVRSCIECDNS